MKSPLLLGFAAFVLIGFEVGAEARDDLVLFAFVEFFLYFFQSEVDYVVVVEFGAREDFAEAEPQAMEQVDFVRGEIRGVGAEDFVDLVPVGHVNFEVELRLLVAEFFPGFANLTGLLFGNFLGGVADDDGAGLERGGGAKNTVPEVVGGDDGEADGFAALFGH